MRQSGEAEIGIILPQKNPIFSPGCKHTVRFIYSFINQVIYKNSYISLVSGENERILFLKIQMGIYPCHKPLTGGFLIPRGTIDLTCQKEVFNYLRTQTMVQVLRVEIVIFYSVGGLEYNGILKTFYMPHCLQLNLKGKRGRESLKIIFG